MCALFSRSVRSNSFWLHGLQHPRLPCPSPIPGAYSNSCPLSWWCHPTTSSSVIPFSSCLQFSPVLGVSIKETVLHIRWPKYWSFSFHISLSQNLGLFKWISSSHQVDKVLEFQLQLPSFRIDWFNLLAVQGLSRVFSNTTVQKHPFFSTQHSW